MAEAGGPRGWITSQNHGYAVDAESLRGTGFPFQWFTWGTGVGRPRGEKLRAWSVQFHPKPSRGRRIRGFFSTNSEGVN